MSKYILISVCDREITTKEFDNHKDALVAMLIQLKEEFMRNYSEEKFVSLPMAKEIGEQGYYNNEEYGFYIRLDIAWSNLDRDCPCSWKIIEVE